MEYFDLDYGQNRIRCHFAGKGRELILCLHGFGESGSSFEPFVSLCGDRYTLVCPDLPFHGDTDWKERYFQPGDLAEIIRLIQERFGVGQSVVLGFSMGARPALSAIAEIPERVSRLILLAPDGLKENLWQQFSSRTWVGNRLLRYFIESPGIFFLSARLGRSLGLVHEGVYKFIVFNMDEPEKRRRVYQVWTGLKEMKTRISVLRRKMNRDQMPLLVALGRFDRLIPEATIQRLFGKMTSCRILSLPLGHMLIHAQTCEAIGEWLGNTPGP
ncbi:MAG TPA: alpha/beta hydrolase [Chitinophagaceae bacterium]|nr:alpha/beta hydrolase [Chitinophagaceae bacterium]